MANLPAVLVDHAHLERKAATSALNLGNSRKVRASSPRLLHFQRAASLLTAARVLPLLRILRFQRRHSRHFAVLPVRAATAGLAAPRLRVQVVVPPRLKSASRESPAGAGRFEINRRLPGTAWGFLSRAFAFLRLNVQGKTLSNFPYSPQLRFCLYDRSVSSDHPKQFMNGANKDSGKSNDDSMKQASAPQASTGSGNLDAAKLTAIVEENRIRINKGWEELRRLDQVLASLDALKTRVQSNAVNPAASAPPQQPDPASIIAKSE